MPPAITYIAIPAEQFELLSTGLQELHRFIFGAPQAVPQPQPASRPKLALTYAEAAALLSVSKRTLQQLVSDGQIANITVAGSKRIEPGAIEQYLENQKTVGLKQ